MSGANDVVNARSSIFYDISGVEDPTITPINAVKGSTFRRVGENGGKFYVKQDDGLTTNWEDLSAGSSAEVVQVSSFSSLPLTGSSGVIYITTDSNNIYRWNGVGYSLLNECSNIVSALIFG